MATTARGTAEPPQFIRGYEAARQDIGRSLAAQLRLDNPRFDPVRFYRAAKLDEASRPTV